MKTYYPFWQAKAIITPQKIEIKEIGKINNTEYTIRTINLENNTIILITADPSEEKIPPENYMKKTYNLDEFKELNKTIENIKTKLKAPIKHEINFYIITPEKDTPIEKIKTITNASITYGEIKNGEIKLEGIPKRILTRELPQNIIIVLPPKGDPKQLIESALNIQQNLSLGRAYAINLIKKYDDYLEIIEEAVKLTENTLNQLSEIAIKEITTKELTELSETSKKLNRNREKNVIRSNKRTSKPPKSNKHTKINGNRRTHTRRNNSKPSTRSMENTTRKT